MLDAVAKAGVKHQAAFNYRFVPAVRQAYELIRSGKLGKLYHFRAFYLQEWIMPHYNTPMIWRTDKKRAGSGALGDLGSHILDLARFLMGEVKSVSGMTKTFISERPLPDGTGMGKVDVDDAFVALHGVRQRRHRHPGSLPLRRGAQELTAASRSTARRGASGSTWRG